MTSLLLAVFGNMYDVLVNLFAHLVEFLVIMFYSIMSVTITFLWDVASKIAEDLDISSKIQQLLSNIQEQIYVNILLFFRIPEIINGFFAAYISRWLLSMTPFF